MLNGMSYDFSWDLPGKKYLEIYDRIRCKPGPEPVGPAEGIDKAGK
jgi:glycogen synthase